MRRREVVALSGVMAVAVCLLAGVAIVGAGSDPAETGTSNIMAGAPPAQPADIDPPEAPGEPRAADAVPMEAASAPETATDTERTAKAARVETPAARSDAGLQTARLEPLADDDPRWDVFAEEPRATAETREAAAAEGEAVQPDSVDMRTTASVEAADGRPVSPSRGVGDDVAALERERTGLQQPNGTVATDDAAANANASGQRAASVNDYVNFRRGPDNDSAVISILPAGTAVQASDDCVHFCEATVDGQNGYIYRSYLDFAVATAAEPSATQ